MREYPARGVLVQNHAMSGRSTRSFLDEGSLPEEALRSSDDSRRFLQIYPPAIAAELQRRYTESGKPAAKNSKGQILPFKGWTLSEK